MSIFIPYTNPIRLRKNVSIDYIDTFPTIDMMTQRVGYQKGIYPSNAIPDYLINKSFEFQIESSSVIGGLVAYITTPSGTFPMSSSVSYLDSYFYNFSYTLTEVGEHYISFADTDQYISDIFYVHDGLDKDLVEITYYDNQNRYGGMFYNSTSQIWEGKAYYTGFIKPSQPEDSQSVYDDEMGNTVILQSTPKRVATLTLTDIHNTYIDVIKQQSICSDFIVNGIKYAASDLNVSDKEKTDVVDITMKLTMQDNDYFFKY